MLHRVFRWRVIVLVGLLTCGVAASGQLQPLLDGGTWAEAQFIPQDRQLANLLDRARSQLSGSEEDQRHGLESVQRILNDAEDYFTDRRMGAGLRGTAQSLLAELPTAGKRLYEQMYGAEARALLDAAADAPDTKLNDIIRRFLMTDAGRHAAITRASTDLDRGQFLAAARLFERLWRLHDSAGINSWERAVTAYWKAGFPTASEDLVLARLTDAASAPVWRGQPVPELTTRNEAAAWLRDQLGAPGGASDHTIRQWLVSGGTVDRNASVTPVTPVFDNAWRVPLLEIADARSPEHLDELMIAVESVATVGREQLEWQTFSVAEPLVIGDTLVFTTYGRVKAVDAETGALRWQAADLDPDFQYLSGASQGKMGTRGTGSNLLEQYVAQRAWLDTTTSVLSSDRERVYQVFDSGFVNATETSPFGTTGSHPLDLPNYNRLRAYDLKSEGKLLWEIGGPPGRVSLPLAGTFFLGAPLPLNDALYVLGEERGQIRLIALDPQTGQLLWSTALLNTSVDINRDLERRLSGLTPSAAGDLLVCPTGGGLIVGVDIKQRALQWSTIYEQPRAVAAPDVFGGRLQQFDHPGESTPSIENLLATPRWYGPSTVISGPYVLHTPPGHDMLHCVNLLDGQALWSRPRQRLLSIAGVHDGEVILVGERHVEAARLETGEVLWTVPLESPSGRSVREGNLLRVPLHSGEIATIDLESGRLLARSPVRSGRALGGLVAADGRLFSQTATEVRGFRSVDELHQQIASDLEADPNNPAALSVRGEMSLHSGQSTKALADLRQSFEVAPDDRVKTLIVNTLVEQLREDFAAHRDAVDELDRLSTDPVQRTRFLRIAAEGLQADGDPVAACQRYLELLTLPGVADDVVHVSDMHTVRLDHWTSGRIRRLFERTDSKTQSDLDALCLEFVESAVDDRDTARLDRAVSAFVSRHAGSIALTALSDLIDPHEQPLRAEAIWLHQRQQDDASVAATSRIRLIQLYAANGKSELVAALLDELSTASPETVIWNEKTGSAAIDALRGEPSVADALSRTTQWPTASIEVSQHPEGTQPQLGTDAIRIVGPHDPVIESSRLHSDGRNVLIAYDGFGNPELTGQMRTTFGYAFPDSNFVERRGHRALLFLDTQFRIIDLLGPQQQPRTILQDDLIEMSQTERFNRSMRRLVRGRMGLRTNWRHEELSGTYLGNTGPLSGSVFCYQKGTTLFAVDPYRGDEVWRLDDITPGCEILADDEYVVLIAPDPRDDWQQARILYSSDGDLAGTRRLPSHIVRDRQGADWGRMILTRTSGAGSDAVTFAMYDPVTGANRWEREFADFRTWAPLDGEDLVILSETGLLQLIDAETGDVIMETQTDTPDDIKSITVVGHPQEWFVFTEHSAREEQQSRLILPSNRMEYHAVNGPAYAFDRKTHQQLWSRELLSLMVDPGLPGRWPVLVLSSEAAAIPGGDRVRAVTRYQNLLLLNKRTGEVVFEGDGTGRWQGTSWSLSEEPPQLKLQFNGTGLSVSFLDSPSKPASRTPPPPDSPQPATPAPEKRRIPAPPLPTPAEGIEQ